MLKRFQNPKISSANLEKIKKKIIPIFWLVVTITLSSYSYEVMGLGSGVQFLLICGKICWFLIENDDEFKIYSIVKSFVIRQKSQLPRLEDHGDIIRNRVFDFLLYKDESSEERLFHLDSFRGLLAIGIGRVY
eukprot:NODE_175_length_14138_cov_1.015314.p12 type:complete len:133 gc:universal NODE_175_length_14138_cov_1.015314:813-415(-)